MQTWWAWSVWLSLFCFVVFQRATATAMRGSASSTWSCGNCLAACPEESASNAGISPPAATVTTAEKGTTGILPSQLTTRKHAKVSEKYFTEDHSYHLNQCLSLFVTLSEILSLFLILLIVSLFRWVFFFSRPSNMIAYTWSALAQRSIVHLPLQPRDTELAPPGPFKMDRWSYRHPF